MHYVGLFSSDDGSEIDPAALHAEQMRLSPPVNEVPGQVGEAVVLAAGEDDAVLLTSVQHYSAGLLLGLELRRRVDGFDWHRVLEDTFVGVELADGTRVVADRARHGAGDHSLHQCRGGGGGRSYETTYWLAPAPPPGDVVVVAHAVGLGLPEGRLVLTATALSAALGQVRELWPWEPARPDLYEPPEPPAPPPGGWFDTARS